MRILFFVLAIFVVTAGIVTRTEAQNYPWCAIYSGGMGAAVQIADLQHFNNAWTPRAGSAAFANQIRNTTLHRGGIHQRSCKGAINIKCPVRELADDD